MMLRLANADILPYDYVEYARTMRRYLPSLERAIATAGGGIDVAPLAASFQRMEAAARAFILAKWGDMIEGQVAAPKHPKAALQEWALARKRKPPEYRLVRRDGPDHAPRFLVAVAVGKLAEAEGEGASKQAAEKAAAAALLDRLTQEDVK